MLLTYLTLQAKVLGETSLYKSAGNHSVKVVPKMFVCMSFLPKFP